MNAYADLRSIRSVWMFSLLVVGLGAGLTAQPARADDPKARKIMEQVRDRDDGATASSDMEMVLIDKRGNQRVRAVRTYRRKEGKDKHSIMFFLSPADVKGTGFLTYDYDQEKKDDDQWLYLPALKKTKRIASGDKSGSFMGSDMNYSDMTTPNLNDFDYTLVKEEDVDGQKTWRIEAVPRNETVMDETGYSKRVIWVRQDNFMVIRSVGYIYKSEDMKFMQVVKLEKIDGVWAPVEMHVATKRGADTLHQTILRFTNIHHNKPLPAEMFTQRKLEKGL
ncbi:MAG: outer membrane lipoprotein-sorting protein [Deltaproteobacteria bacterium]|nr:outer membrane lipoprotein-sorting protein [Deltaproteobacteria bacterium]